MDINIAQLCLDAVGITLNKAHCLSIVIPESFLSVKEKADIAAEAIPVLRFNTSS
jgi:hypothetical protein